MSIIPPLINEVSEKTLVYHRSFYPMKVGDVVVPKKDEEGKHWMESKEAEVALEMYRRENYPAKPSRFNCVYSSVIPRSRFVDKGTLYVVRPRGKMHVADSGIIDLLNDEYGRDFYRQSTYWIDDFRQRMKDDPRASMQFLDYGKARMYWTGDTIRGSFKAIKEDVEVLSDAAEVMEVIHDRPADIRENKVYEVTESDKILAKLTTGDRKENAGWEAFHDKVVHHLFSSLDDKKRFGEIGYLKKGLRIKPRIVKTILNKSSDDIRSPEDRSRTGKYSRMSFGFEMDGKWYMPWEDKFYAFDVGAFEFLRHYHKQPYDFGKYLKEV